MWIFSFDALVQFYILMGVIFVTFVSDMSFMSVIALISVSSIGLWDWGFDPPLNCTHSNLLLMASRRASSQKLLWEQLYPREEHVWAPKQHSAWCKKGVFILTFCCDWGWFLFKSISLFWFDCYASVAYHMGCQGHYVFDLSIHWYVHAQQKHSPSSLPSTSSFESFYFGCRSCLILVTLES